MFKPEVNFGELNNKLKYSLAFLIRPSVYPIVLWIRDKAIYEFFKNS